MTHVSFDGLTPILKSSSACRVRCWRSSSATVADRATERPPASVCSADCVIDIWRLSTSILLHQSAQISVSYAVVTSPLSPSLPLYIVGGIPFARTLCSPALRWGCTNREGQQRWHPRSMSIGRALYDGSSARRRRAVGMIGTGNCVLRAPVGYWRRRNVAPCTGRKIQANKATA
jgi:hypothetical protein